MRPNDHILREISEGKKPSSFLADMIGYLLMALAIWLAYTLGSSYLDKRINQLKNRKKPVVVESNYSQGLSKLRTQINASTASLKSTQFPGSL